MNNTPEPSLLTPSGLNRRIKRHLFSQEQSFAANCAPGLESILSQELAGTEHVQVNEVSNGTVEFSGPFDLVYTANLHLRTANRVLMRFAEFTVRSYPELYNKARRFSWELFAGFGGPIAINVSAKKSRLHHQGNIADSLFEAISFKMNSLGTEVSRAEESPITLFARLHDDQCTLSFDTSGELLYKRGYRSMVGAAPLRESVAAALLMAGHWERFPVIADPFCGSGVFGIEAALLAHNRPPGSVRQFAFMHWPSYLEHRWKRYLSLGSGPAKTPAPRLLLSDNDAEVLTIGRDNAARAGVSNSVEFSQGDALDFNKDRSLGPSGLIITNPPFGKRIGNSQDLTGLYREFGSRLRESCQGWRWAMIIPDRSFLAALKFRPETVLPFGNGGLKVELAMGTVPADSSRPG
jgi:putative N6-adenine-specific DNA methylase